jgi:hypothetical protein
MRICLHCGQGKPPEAFGASPAYCKACIAAYYSGIRKTYRQVDSGTRICGACGKRQPVEEFGTGSPYCRACVRTYHRDRRASIKGFQLSQIAGKRQKSSNRKEN